LQGLTKTHLSARPINQNDAYERSQKVNHTNNDRTDIAIDGGTSILEDLHRVEDHRIDTTQLLEEHQTQRDGQRLQIVAFQQLQHGVLGGLTIGIGLGSH